MYRILVRIFRVCCLSICLFSILPTILCAQEKDTIVNPGLDLVKYVFQDTIGKNVTFQEFKGKYILLDIWASWCYPCINEFPHFDSLKNELRDKNIVFVQLSCDQQAFRWKGAVAMFKRKGIQWFLNGDKQFMIDLKVGYIPRYILIDRKGVLMNAYMPRASSPDLKRNLEQLEGI
ncbi:MAG: TlpA disulfide reductase family protein [Arachidicoccus sp.]|nr:TlpA disulfide reductase family protein [Arachidicoccus sp.]